jgi:hypothetical protein
VPPISMVLKVVTGNIQKTWKLSRYSTVWGSVLERKLSKIVDYLIDNLRLHILSQMAA